MNDEKKRILEMVKEGLLNADEALLLLEQLDKKEKLIQKDSQQESRELATTVQPEGERKEEQQTKRTVSTMDRIMGVVDDVVKKIKDIDFDWNFGSSIEIDHLYHQEAKPFNIIDIDVANGEVSIIPWDRDEVDIECKAKVYRAENTTEAREKLQKQIVNKIENGKLKFTLHDRAIKLKATIKVPKHRYQELRIRLFNGGITGENLNVDEIKAKTANGAISFRDFNAREAEFETANGSIKLLSFDAGELEVDTMNGGIQVDGAFRTADIQTMNGSITCKQAGQYGETLRAKAQAGSINLQIPQGTSCDGELKSNLGSFNLDLKGIQVIEEKNDIVQKMLRFQSMLEEEHSMHVFAESKTGSIKVKHTL
ncbi:DUF4097 family beta strand repeat-containing protein [Pradoshia sp.]